jgi:hypothetical protein
LIARGKQVSVVVDACGYFDRSEAELTVRLLGAKGATLITVDELMARRLPRPIRYPHQRGNGSSVAGKPDAYLGMEASKSRRSTRRYASG